MRFVLERLTQPVWEPVTLAEMIEQVSEFTSIPLAKQEQLSGLIVAAREWAEDYTGRVLVEQEWRLSISNNPAAFSNVDSNTVTNPNVGSFVQVSDGSILLRKSPVLDIVKIESIDSAGVATEIAADAYELRDADSKWPRVMPLGVALTGTLSIHYRAGYAETSSSPADTVAAVPMRFKQAIRLHAEAHYDRDKDMMEKLLAAAQALIKPERVELQLA